MSSPTSRRNCSGRSCARSTSAKKGRATSSISRRRSLGSALDPDRIVACFLRYLEHGGLRVSRTEFEENLAEKLEDRVFLSDVPPLLRLGIAYDPAAVVAQVREVLLAPARACAETEPKALVEAQQIPERNERRRAIAGHITLSPSDLNDGTVPARAPHDPRARGGAGRPRLPGRRRRAGRAPAAQGRGARARRSRSDCGRRAA